MYFHTDDPAFIEWFAGVTERARREELSLRLKTLSDGSLQVKLGGGGWTAPFASTFDLARDRHCGHDECHQRKNCVYA